MPRIAVLFTGGTIAMRSVGRRPPTCRAARRRLLASFPVSTRSPTSSRSTGAWSGLAPLVRPGARHRSSPGRGLPGRRSMAPSSSRAPTHRRDLVRLGSPAAAGQAGRRGRRDAIGLAGGLRRAGEPPRRVAAAAMRARRQGVVVAMAGELHAADDVRKTHTHAYATFQSPNAGRLGTVAAARSRSSGGGHSLDSRPCRRMPRCPSRSSAGPRRARHAGRVAARPRGRRGRVGNTPAAPRGGATSWRARPVALTTRCPSGRPLPGTGSRADRPGGRPGPMFSGTLDGLKARVLIALGLGAGLSHEELDRPLRRVRWRQPSATNDVGNPRQALDAALMWRDQSASLTIRRVRDAPPRTAPGRRHRLRSGARAGRHAAPGRRCPGRPPRAGFRLTSPSAIVRGVVCQGRSR